VVRDPEDRVGIQAEAPADPGSQGLGGVGDRGAIHVRDRGGEGEGGTVRVSAIDAGPAVSRSLLVASTMVVTVDGRRDARKFTWIEGERFAVL
jgi:hypothetical protein